MESGVEFIASDMPYANRLMSHKRQVGRKPPTQIQCESRSASGTHGAIKQDSRAFVANPCLPMECERRDLNPHPFRDWILRASNPIFATAWHLITSDYNLLSHRCLPRPNMLHHVASILYRVVQYGGTFEAPHQRGFDPSRAFRIHFGTSTGTAYIPSPDCMAPIHARDTMSV